MLTGPSAYPFPLFPWGLATTSRWLALLSSPFSGALSHFGAFVSAFREKNSVNAEKQRRPRHQSQLRAPPV
jgi:hypothetical protein